MTTACLLALILAAAGWAAYLAGLWLITVMLGPPVSSHRVRKPCRYCGRLVRPCSLRAHVTAHHREGGLPGRPIIVQLRLFAR